MKQAWAALEFPPSPTVRTGVRSWVIGLSKDTVLIFFDFPV